MYELTYDAAVGVLRDFIDLTVAQVTDNVEHWAARVADAAARVGDLGHDLTFLATVANTDPTTLGWMLDDLDTEDVPGCYVHQTTALVWRLVYRDAGEALADPDQVRALLG